MDLYVTISTMKAHNKIDNDVEDDLIRQYILTAQEEAEMRMHRPIYSATDETAVTNDKDNIPASIIQFILMTSGDLYRVRENQQEKKYETFCQHLLDRWIKYA
jgi:hypothetical protein